MAARGPMGASGPTEMSPKERPLIRPFGLPSPWVGKAYERRYLRLPPSGGELSSEARLMRGRTVGRRPDGASGPTVLRYFVGAACGRPGIIRGEAPYTEKREGWEAMSFR